MDIEGSSCIRTKKILSKLSLLIFILIITLSSNYTEVNAGINDSININLNNKIYSVKNQISDNILDNIIVALTGKISAYEVILDNDVIGYTVMENNLNNIKDIILKKYIEENSIREDMVKHFDIKGEIS